MASHPPAVTVVIPTHNRGPVLSRAVGSVLGQTFGDFELLVVDDASTDDVPAVLRAFRDPRLRVVRLDGPPGASRARNGAIRLAQGKLVAFLDSDDEWLPAKLERQVARLRDVHDSRVGVVYCRCAGVDHRSGRRFHHTRPLHEGDVFRHLLGGWHPPTASAVVVARAPLDRAGGFDETLPAAGDYDLWLRLAQAGVHFAAVPEVLVVKHDNEGPQLTTDPDARARADEVLLARWGPLIQQHLGPEAHRRWRAERAARLQIARYRRIVRAVDDGERRLAWRQSRLLLDSDPGSVLSYAALARTVLGARAFRALQRLIARALPREAGGTGPGDDT